MKSEYTSRIVAKVLRVPLRKVTSMIERGYIVSSIRDAAGHGSKRLFSFDDVLRAFVIHNLESLGLSVEKLRFVAGVISNSDELALPLLKFFTSANDPTPILWVPLKSMRDCVVSRILALDCL